MAMVEDLYDSSRLLLWEYEAYPETPHGFGGTVFLFTWKGMHAFAAAKHSVLLGRGGAVSIWAEASGEDVVPVAAVYDVKDPDLEDPDYADLTLFVARTAELTGEQRAAFERVDLVALTRQQAPLRKGDPLVITGYPNSEQEIDFERREIHHGRVVLRGEYEETSLRQACHLLRFADVGSEEGRRIVDHNGMSGSPVWKIQLKERLAIAELAGVLLLAGAGRGTFVDAAVLVRMLDKALALQQHSGGP